MAQIVNQEARERILQSLRHAMGEIITKAMLDPYVTEIMLNPDGTLWLDRVGVGLEFTGHTLDASAGDRIIRTLATHGGVTVTAAQPRVSATLPQTGERFQGGLPPVAKGPFFAIRKRPEIIFRLDGEPDSYVETGIMTADQAAIIRQAVIDHQNIVVAGGTGTGKTTLVNAILAEEAFRRSRVLTMEDTEELQCIAENRISLFTVPGTTPVKMNDLVFDALRLRPDRIIGGEVREGATALTLLKAWNTGHPGGCTTIHANSAYEALTRFEDLIGEVAANVPKRSIGQAVNVVIYVERTKQGRRIKQVIKVSGYNEDARKYEYEDFQQPAAKAA